MKTIKTKSAVRAYDSGDAFFDLEYYIDDTEAGVFIATVKVTVPLDRNDGLTLSDAQTNGADRVRQVLSDLLSQ
jgi:hypothetical protein